MEVNDKEYQYQGNEGEKVPRNVQRLIVNPGIHVLPDELFINCERLREVTLPDGLVEIGCRTFMRCTSLLEIKNCSTIESIGGQAFEECHRLKNAEFCFFIVVAPSAKDNWQKSFLVLPCTTKNQDPLVYKHGSRMSL